VTAREFAIKAPGDQKCSDLPYVFHLDDFPATLHEFGVFDRSLIEASYLPTCTTFWKTLASSNRNSWKSSLHPSLMS
jgi:hypothetical protein